MMIIMIMKICAISSIYVNTFTQSYFVMFANLFSSLF